MTVTLLLKSAFIVFVAFFAIRLWIEDGKGL